MPSTPNYDLPLLESSNLPSWLTDWNTAMSKIDTAIKEASESGGSGGRPSITVDSQLSTTSGNPVQNKVITAAINALSDRLDSYFDIAITSQPQDTSVQQGGTYSFTVVATGYNLSYQWYSRLKSTSEATWTPHAGHNSATFTGTTSSDVVGAQWEYYCKVTNGVGVSVDSEVATLTLVATPTNYVFTNLAPDTGITVDHSSFSNYTGTISPAPEFGVYLVFMDGEILKKKIAVEIRNVTNLYNQVHYSSIPLYAGKYDWHFETTDMAGNTYKSESRSVFLT